MSGLDVIRGVNDVRQSVTVDLGDYNPAYAGATFEVWVTPTRAHNQRFQAIMDYLEQANKEAREALAKLDKAHQEEMFRLSEQGTDARELAQIERQYQARRAELDARAAEQMQDEFEERLLQWMADTWLNWTLEDAREARDHLLEHNPDAWKWLWNRTTQVIGEYKRGTLKNSAGG